MRPKIWANFESSNSQNLECNWDLWLDASLIAFFQTNPRIFYPTNPIHCMCAIVPIHKNHISLALWDNWDICLCYSNSNSYQPNHYVPIGKVTVVSPNYIKIYIGDRSKRQLEFMFLTYMIKLASNMEHPHSWS